VDGLVVDAGGGVVEVGAGVVEVGAGVEDEGVVAVLLEHPIINEVQSNRTITRTKIFFIDPPYLFFYFLTYSIQI
jgi:hypothetical protein